MVGQYLLGEPRRSCARLGEIHAPPRGPDGRGQAFGDFHAGPIHVDHREAPVDTVSVARGLTPAVPVRRDGTSGAPRMNIHVLAEVSRGVPCRTEVPGP
jgi:hypothetical protein